MALREMPCAAASALKRASQVSKLPAVRQSAAAAAVATSIGASAQAARKRVPKPFMVAIESLKQNPIIAGMPALPRRLWRSDDGNAEPPRLGSDQAIWRLFTETNRTIASSAVMTSAKNKSM